jgi:hypothetical protein
VRHVARTPTRGTADVHLLSVVSLLRKDGRRGCPGPPAPTTHGRLHAGSVSRAPPAPTEEKRP